MRKLISFCCLLFAFSAFGQNGSIKGTVIDKGMADEPVLFANIQLEGEKQSVETNFHGNFEIKDLEPGNYTLVISYLGYETIEMPITVVKNEITTVEGGISPLSFSMNDLNLEDEVSEIVKIEEYFSGERPKK